MKIICNIETGLMTQIRITSNIQLVWYNLIWLLLISVDLPSVTDVIQHAYLKHDSVILADKTGLLERKKDAERKQFNFAQQMSERYIYPRSDFLAAETVCGTNTVRDTLIEPHFVVTFLPRIHFCCLFSHDVESPHLLKKYVSRVSFRDRKKRRPRHDWKRNVSRN